MLTFKVYGFVICSQGMCHVRASIKGIYMLWIEQAPMRSYSALSCDGSRTFPELTEERDHRKHLSHTA